MTSPELLLWPILLMVAGCALAATEVFVPSGGILGFLSALAVVASIVMAFIHHGPAAGLSFSVFACFALPICLAMALKYWPQTAMGKRFLLGLPTEEEIIPDDLTRQLKGLVGRIGRARSPMLPAGAVEIEGRVLDAISQGMAIDPGQYVKIIEVRANRVVVRPVEPGEELSARNPDDVLSQPIDSLGLDDEPLG